MAKGTTALKKISKETKRLRAAHPGMSFKSAQAKASQAYRAGSLSGVKAPKKKAAAKRVGSAPKYRVTHKVERVSGITYRGGSVRLSGMETAEKAKASLRRSLAEQIGWLEVGIAQATTAKEKKGLQKMLVEKRRELRKIA